MVNQRFNQVATSDDEDELPPQQMELLEEEDNDDNDNEKEEEDEEKEGKKEEQSQTPEDAKPIGNPVNVSGKGRRRKRHYEFFNFEWQPIYSRKWFYHPEEAETKGGGSWQSHDTRELFYAFHHDEVLTESVMHKCVVHFVPIHKQLPCHKQYPGFIVQKVYDTMERKLWNLIDKDYEDVKQQEIDQKTLKRICELVDIETEE